MELNIPEGIHYECTGCGKCCSGWAVPLTEEDYERLSPIDWGNLNPELKDKKLFRKLKPSESVNTPYTHAIIPTSEGQCPFLNNNLCFIHSQYGIKVKPSICQLFPYSFNETPSGIFTTVSFISRGAIHNAGRALTEQKDYLLEKYAEFQKLFPDHHPNWSAIKLSSNIPISWEEYCLIEKKLLHTIKDNTLSLENRFILASIYLNSLLAAQSDKNDLLSKVQDHKSSPSIPTQINQNNPAQPVLNSWDKILLNTLYNKYFSDKKNGAISYGQLNLNLPAFFLGARTKDFVQLITKNLPFTSLDKSPEIKDLIFRFFYSRIFTKLYFGAGFGQLSLIAGFNHLALLLFLLKLKIQDNARLRNSKTANMDDAVNATVQLEKNLGELKISPYGAASLEVLLNSQHRIARLMHFLEWSCQGPVPHQRSFNQA